ncbi:MAG: ion channel, partial [Desulfobacterales bacterium]
FSPTTPATKLITIFYGLNGVILLLMLFDVIRQVRGWAITPGGEKVEDQEQ